MQRQSILWLLGSVRGMLRHGHDAEWLTLLAQVLERSPEASSCLPPSSSRPTSNLQRGIHASILSSGQLHLQSLLSAPSPRSWLLVEPHGLGVTLLRLTDVLCSQMYRVLTKSQHMPAPVQADLGRLEQVGVSGARRRRLRHPARTGGSGAAPDPARPWPRRRGAAAAPRAPSAAPARAPSTLPAAAARAPTAGEISTHAVLDTSRDMLQEMLSLAHLPLCLPEPLVLSQQVECP